MLRKLCGSGRRIFPFKQETCRPRAREGDSKTETLNKKLGSIVYAYEAASKSSLDGLPSTKVLQAPIGLAQWACVRFPRGQVR